MQCPCLWTQRWWPLLPLYPYSRRTTLLTELIPGEVWSLEQLQGIYYVAVPIRLTVVRISGGLMLVNPLPPTLELQNLLQPWLPKSSWSAAVAPKTVQGRNFL